jgi:predicted DNA-binding protein with PD1-like motif
MEYKRFGSKVVVRLDEGDEIISSVTELCKQENITAGFVSGIGFTTEMRVRIYDKAQDQFLFQTITGSMEITSLTGNVVQADNGLFTHLHIMAADQSMNIRGGHLVSCTIAATGELVIEALEGSVTRGESDDFRLGTMRFDGNR